MDKYNQWKNNPNLDPALKSEIMAMTDKEIEDAFYTNLEFGTAGMRGILGAGTNRMNIYTVRKANVGFAKYLLTKPNAKEKGVAIGYDNRHMSYRFAMESAKVLATYGIKSFVFESLRPTPELSFAVRYLKCAGGIMITASHNPKEYNGYKVYDDTGCQLIPEWADEVVAYVNEVEDELNVEVCSDEVAYPYISYIGEEVDEAYYEAVMGIEVNPGMDKSDYRIVFSPEHGTSNIPVRTVLKRLGYDIEVGDNALHTKDELNKLYKLDSERYTYLLSPSAFCTEKFSSAFNLPVNNPNVEIVQEGYPRNDFLSNYKLDDVQRVRKSLGIENVDKKIILYAPTWRDNQYKNGGYSLDLPVDFKKLQAALEDEYIILFRAHYFVANAFDFSSYEGFIYNVSDYDDINDLYIISDVLITDYSSVFFDYSILKRPIIYYMYDLESYGNVIRGFYISLDDLPGPIVQTEEEVIKAIQTEFVYTEKYQAFNSRFTSFEDGKATKRVIDRCFK